MELFKHGQTVRIVELGTPSQRQCLWVVDLSNHASRTDWGNGMIQIHRQGDPDSIIGAPRKNITAATVLDLLVAD